MLSRVGPFAGLNVYICMKGLGSSMTLWTGIEVSLNSSGVLLLSANYRIAKRLYFPSSELGFQTLWWMLLLQYLVLKLFKSF